MAYLSLSNKAIEELANGETIEITHPDLGCEGHNGTALLVPEDDEELSTDWKIVEEQ